ncbi:hypothetical protein Tco_1094238 [Tanacetum coccineum]|uniref:Uncharacterized protein n=1 Tax=Tanacetum coccineum TaxID=301880 RepID=A0ABQ5IEZ8_9ASTR
MESRNASSLKIYFLVFKETKSTLECQSVQDQRQRDNNDLQDKRQNKPRKKKLNQEEAKGQENERIERISKKRTKNEAKKTKPGTEWKSVEKTKSRQSPSVKKSTQVNPDKSKGHK